MEPFSPIGQSRQGGQITEDGEKNIFGQTLASSRQSDRQEAPHLCRPQILPTTRHVLAKRTYTGPSARRVGEGGSREGLKQGEVWDACSCAVMLDVGARIAWAPDSSWGEVGGRCAVGDRVLGGRGARGDCCDVISASALTENAVHAAWVGLQISAGASETGFGLSFQSSFGRQDRECMFVLVRVLYGALMRVRVGIALRHPKDIPEQWPRLAMMYASPASTLHPSPKLCWLLVCTPR